MQAAEQRSLLSPKPVLDKISNPERESPQGPMEVIIEVTIEGTRRAQPLCKHTRHRGLPLLEWREQGGERALRMHDVIRVEPKIGRPKTQARAKLA